MSSKVIRFSDHAINKFEVLGEHGLRLEEQTVTKIVRKPDAVFDSFSGRKIAQGRLDEKRVLRVIFEDRGDEIIVITFYPGKRDRYEKSQI